MRVSKPSLEESYLSWTLNSNLNFLGCKGHSVPDGGHSLGEGSAVGGSTVCGCFYDGLDQFQAGPGSRP